MFGFSSFSEGEPAAGAVGTVGKPERFLRRLFQVAVEIINKKMPKATLSISIATAVSTALPDPHFLGNARNELDRFCTLKKEMPQAATWGQDPCHQSTDSGANQ